MSNASDSPSDYVQIWFPGAWPDLNWYINVERGSAQAAARIKASYTAAAEMIAQAYSVGRVKTPCTVTCTWHLNNRRKDPDNVAFAIKFLLDGLVRAGVLPNDGQKDIRRIVHEFVHDDCDGVSVALAAVGK
jgi:Holliday junction resolvase RusA-like endonuclease